VILNVSRNVISSGNIAMFGPAKTDSVSLGSAIFGPLEPERSSAFSAARFLRVSIVCSAG
jgi:hypothetical protein